MDDEKKVRDKIKIAKADLEEKVIAQYPTLSIDEIKHLVVERKWICSIRKRIETEMDNISHRLTQRIKELVERYEITLPELSSKVDDLTLKVEAHLKRMNFVW